MNKISEIYSTIIAIDIKCELCGKYPKVTIDNRDKSYEIYCYNCNCYLDDGGKVIE